jgi:hypothetical protein
VSTFRIRRLLQVGLGGLKGFESGFHMRLINRPSLKTAGGHEQGETGERDDQRTGETGAAHGDSLGRGKEIRQWVRTPPGGAPGST